MLQLVLVIATIIGFAGCQNSANSGKPKGDPMAKIANRPDGLYALITTEKGEILLSLEMDKTPVTVANFVALAEGKMKNSIKPEGKPFYDSLTFHRVIPNFMIQGGDPMGTGQGGPGYSFADEIDSTLKFDKKGVLAMANAGPATNGSQFFITHVPTPWLDGKHSIFGAVLDGQNIVDSTKQGDHMLTVQILRKGDKAKAFDANAVFKKGQEEALKKVEEQKQADALKLEEYKKKAKSTPSGLMYIMEKPGSGKNAAPGDSVTVHYTGTLLNGTKFDSSFDHPGAQPISFPLANKPPMVIAGWEEGLLLFKAGGKGKLIIPSDLAYGPNSPSPVIPPNSILVFEIEMVKIVANHKK